MPDAQIARQSWEDHKKRNDSIIIGWFWLCVLGWGGGGEGREGEGEERRGVERNANCSDSQAVL